MTVVRDILTARYRPRPARASIVTLLQYLIGFNAVIRGLDYVTGSNSKVADIVTIGTVINQVVNLSFWGWAFLIFGWVLLIALLTKRHFFVFVGHGVLLAAYALLMVSSAQAVWQFHDDFRALLPPLSGMILNGYFAIRLKPWPREVIAPMAVSKARGDDPGYEEEREEYL